MEKRYQQHRLFNWDELVAADHTGVGRLSLIQDPQGAAIAIIAYESQTG